MGNQLEFYFEVLNIPKDSSPQQIRSAYRTLVKQWHPDKHPPSSRPEAEAKFKAISEAYEVLNDQENSRATFGPCDDGDGSPAAAGITTGVRPKHHRSQESALRATSNSGRELNDFYYSKASGGAAVRPAFSSFSSSVRRKPPPVERKLECTLEELCHGCKKEIKFTRDVVMKNGLIVKKEESHTISVKPGWKRGTRITFEGMGDERLGCLSGDVVFLISEKEHPMYKRVGNDLGLKVEVPLVNALTGWSFAFRLLTGEKMSCYFHEDIIYPGYEKIIKGQGMPIANEKGLRGDLRIKFHIVFPTQLSNEQRSSIAELLKDST